MKALCVTLLLCILSVSTFASEVYKCTYRGNTYVNGSFENYFTLIVDGNRVIYYLQVNNIFDGSDVQDKFKTIGNRLPTAGIGVVSDVGSNGDLKVTGDSLVSAYDAATYGRPLNRYLLISNSIFHGEKSGHMLIVNIVHDGRSKDPSRALPPRTIPTSCVRTK